jgi:hypothetical protein
MMEALKIDLIPTLQDGLEKEGPTSETLSGEEQCCLEEYLIRHLELQ